MVDDRDLLLAIARADRAAFAELFRRYAPRIAGFLRQSMPAAKAEELTQDVMLRIWRKASTYDPVRAAPSTWIFTIARNARTDALRRTGRPEPDPEDPVWVPSGPDAPDVEAARRDEEGKVRAALDALPAAQLQVVERAYLQGQTLAEVAESLGIPLGTVKSRVRLALERLRAVLPDPDADGGGRDRDQEQERR